jgi:hypothetical protein
MCSTAYQQLVIDAFSASEHSARWLLRLKDVAIPSGFDDVRNLREGKPTTQRDEQALHEK